MFDTVNLRLQSGVVGVDFLADTPRFLEEVGEHVYGDDVVITGRLGGLKVSLNSYRVKIGEGSLCKWYLGDNYNTMGRGDTQRAFEKLSDTLHLPIDKAVVTRMDIAQNFICKYPVEVYLNHLGVLKYAKRLVEPTGLYYVLNGGRLCFYDKNKESRGKGEPIPDLFKERNVLRYEQRYTKRISKQLKMYEVLGCDLYSEQVYTELLKLWKQAYFSINKINDVILNFECVKTKTDLYKMGVLALMEQMGGQTQMLQFVSEAQKKGDLTSKQAYDIRKVFNEASKVKGELVVKNDAIEELDRCVREAVRFYR